MVGVKPVVFLGDLVMGGSVGRTDLPGCDQEKMTKSLRRILRLPMETQLCSGHAKPIQLDFELMVRAHLPLETLLEKLL